MATRTRARAIRLAWWCGALCAAAASPAADVGGWFADQQKAAAAAAAGATMSPTCPQAVTRATAQPSALSAYQAAHCYLQPEATDLVAAKAWLTRAAGMNFLPAHRLLRALQLAEAGEHGNQRHCHDLGEGRQICHGGGAPPPTAGTQ